MVAGMDVLVRTFLDIIQPNDFPSDLIGDFASNVQPGLSNESAIRAALINNALKYELGFLVCLAIGLLYIVLMPLIGVCLARQKTSRPGNSAPLYWGAYTIVMAVILVGNVYLCISNAAIKRYVDDSTKVINGTLNNLRNYAGGLLGNIEQEVYGTVDLLKDKLNATGPELGGQIKNRLVAGLHLTEIRCHAKNMSNFSISRQLKNFSSTLTKLKTFVPNPEVNPYEKIFRALDDLLEGLSDLQSKVQAFGPDLEGKLQGNEKYLNDIPDEISNVTKDVIETDIETQIQRVKGSLGHVSEAVDGTFGELQDATTAITTKVKKVGYIIWAVGVALCCVLVLVLVHNILGLLVGSVGVDPVVSFLLCSMLMVMLMPLFLLGGHSYTLVCKPWRNGELFRFIDKRIEFGAMLGLNSSLNLTDVYNNCNDKRSVWDTLHLLELLDLEEMLNVPQGLDVSKFMAAFDSMSITFLSNDDKENISNLIATEINFTEITEELEKINLGYKTVDKCIKELIGITNDLRSQVETFNDTVADLLSKVGNVQLFLKDDSKTAIEGIVGAYLGNLTAGLSARFTSQIKQVNCMTVAKEVDNAKSFICENMVTSLNTLWFSLGMCLIFFIPSIVLSVKLANCTERRTFSL